MSVNREDYLKVIFELGGAKQSVSNKAISEALGLSPASVTEMISKMAKDNMVTYTPYRGTKLSEEGILQGANLVRRHRLWEVFLYDKLNYTWENVHDEAEMLEHNASDFFVEKLADFLGNPEFCPHGGAIPTVDGEMAEEVETTLVDFEIGDDIRIQRVTDEKEFLMYFDQLGLKIGKKYTITGVEAFTNNVILTKKGNEIVVNREAAQHIYVEKE
ncbi:metal-dependent transcriptional regulator [Aerococcus suis]